MTHKPTPAHTPWRVGSRRKIVQKTDGFEINPIMAVTIEHDHDAPGNPPFAFITDKEKAAHIVRCVNSHESDQRKIAALVEALQSCFDFVAGLASPPDWDTVRAALNLAKGE